MATAVKERPMLMSAPMVRATLADLKGQTRRTSGMPQLGPQAKWLLWEGHSWKASGLIGDIPDEWLSKILYCPYGVPGDRLWIRESWQCPEYEGSRICDIPQGADVAYAADFGVNEPGNRKWRPSIHMPRWASRITLEITEVRVERLQDISEEDAIAEGFDADLCASVFADASKGIRWEYERCLRDDDGNYDESDFCPECADKIIGTKSWKDRFGQTHKTFNATMIDGWDESHESDTVKWCERCGVLLHHSLTQYGVERELLLEGGAEPCCPVRGQDASILQNLAGGIGDLRDEYLGRLAQFGFATLWDTINGKSHPWSANPWVWAISFRRI